MSRNIASGLIVAIGCLIGAMARMTCDQPKLREEGYELGRPKSAMVCNVDEDTSQYLVISNDKGQDTLYKYHDGNFYTREGINHKESRQRDSLRQILTEQAIEESNRKFDSLYPK